MLLLLLLALYNGHYILGFKAQIISLFAFVRYFVTKTKRKLVLRNGVIAVLTLTSL